MSMKLYVGGFSYSTTEDQLKEMFEEHGQVISAVVINDRQTGRSRGFGFVEMSDLKEGQAAIKALDGQEKNGRTLVVNAARERENNSPNRRNGFRR